MQKCILEKVKKLYAVGADLELLGGFDNNVFISREKKIVFKFLNTEKHKKDTLLKELQFVELLTTNGVTTPSPIPSRNGKVIELVKGLKNEFYIIAFPKVEGKVLHNYEEDNHLIKQWGRTLGGMHEISKKYASKLDKSYLEWDHDINYEGFSTGRGKIIKKKWSTYLERLSSLPRDQAVYGVVHHDLHHQNIMINSDKMYVLDFGDVRKSWYAYDASIPIYHALENNRLQKKMNRLTFYERFTKHFFEGYCEKTTLSEEQYKLIPFFLEYRLLYSYLYFSNSFKCNEMSVDMKNILSDMRFRIENDVPFVK